MPDMTLEQAARLLRHPWGQGFEAPAFDDSAVIDAVKPMGKDGVHGKVQACVGGREHRTEVVLFNQPEPQVGHEIHLYLHLQPGLNTWREQTKLKWMGRVLHWPQ